MGPKASQHASGRVWRFAPLLLGLGAGLLREASQPRGSAWAGGVNFIPKTTSSDALKGSVQDQAGATLATLANSAGILAPGPTMTRGGSIISIDGSISIRGLTAGDGPFLVGIMNKDLSLAELEAYLELDGPVHMDDTTGVEIASRGRKIRRLGVLAPSGDGTVAGLFVNNVSLKGLRFTEESAGWTWWTYNLGVNMTTGAIVTFLQSLFVRWQA